MREKMMKVKDSVRPRSPKAIAAVLQQKDRQIELLSQLIVVMGIFNAFATLPQVYALWGGKDATGLSLLSWLYYLVFSIVLLIFGIMQRQRPLIITYGSGSIGYLLIVVGIIVYR